MCAGNYTHGGADFCLGDWGGPLVCDGMLAGLASWGHEDVCGEPFSPGVYTEIAYFQDWIRNKTGTGTQV